MFGLKLGVVGWHILLTVVIGYGGWLQVSWWSKGKVPGVFVMAFFAVAFFFLYRLVLKIKEKIKQQKRVFNPEVFKRGAKIAGVITVLAIVAPLLYGGWGECLRDVPVFLVTVWLISGIFWTVSVYDAYGGDR